MKFFLIFITLFFCFTSFSQVDTLILDYTDLSKSNNTPLNGYIIIKKNGIKIQECKSINGNMVGVFKSYHDNGSIKEISEYSKYYHRSLYSGTYKEYYSNGNLKVEGNYQIQDSIECVGCFDNNLLKNVQKAQSNTMKIGVWKEYHENGVLSAKGWYKGIHEVYGHIKLEDSSKDYLGTFYAGDYSEDYLKNELWEYFDEVGKLKKEETYKNGFLVDVVRH